MATSIRCLVLVLSLGAVLCQEGAGQAAGTTTTSGGRISSAIPASSTPIPDGVVSPTGEDQEGGEQQPEEDEQVYAQQASPQEIQRRLGHLVEEYVDRDQDKAVTVEELRDWIKGIQELMADEEVERQWSYYHAPDLIQERGRSEESQKAVPADASLSWETYKELTYPEEAMSQTPPPGELSPKELLSRAQRRWKKADLDNDNKLNKEEFKVYLYPENKEHMKELLVSESTEDMDKDKNKEVSLEEFMEHMKKLAGPDEVDEQWKQVQKNQFENFLDKNKDGSLDAQEIKEWILPPYDRHDAEAWRLLTTADEDRDEKLTKEDIVKHYQHFMVLQPPEFWIEGIQSAKHDEF